jgi:hypothetical protein
MAPPRGEAPPTRTPAGAAMSAPRIKFQIWNDRKQYWVTAYCLITLLQENLIHMKAFGIETRVGSECR